MSNIIGITKKENHFFVNFNLKIGLIYCPVYLEGGKGEIKVIKMLNKTISLKKF